jgi:predicted transporter
MDIAYAIVAGIIFSVIVFGLKAGAGCGFSSIGFKKVIILGAAYFVISVVMGALTGHIDTTRLENIAGMGMAIHSLLAVFLIGAGIYTSKKWNCGCDVSKHTFMFLSLPCPVCLSALFLSCMVLVTTLEVKGIWVGTLVGIVFFISAVSSAYLFRKMGKKPDTLGSIMLFLGIFYMLGVLLIPAYIKTQSMNLQSTSYESVGLLPFLVVAVFILAGYYMGKRRSV